MMKRVNLKIEFLDLEEYKQQEYDWFFCGNVSEKSKFCYPLKRFRLTWFYWNLETNNRLNVKLMIAYSD